MSKQEKHPSYAEKNQQKLAKALRENLLKRKQKQRTQQQKEKVQPHDDSL